MKSDQEGSSHRTTDDLLQDAGSKWRKSFDTPPIEVASRKLMASTEEPRRRSGHGWRISLAAAATAACLAGAALFVVHVSGQDRSSGLPMPSESSTARTLRGSIGDPSLMSLMLQDGASVTAVGYVHLSFAGDHLLCTDTGVKAGSLVIGTSGPESTVSDCSATTLVAYLTFSTGAEIPKDAAEKRIQGVYRAGRIDVDSIEPYVAPQAGATVIPTPCTAPAGGWPAVTKSTIEGAFDKLQAYATAHPDEFVGPWSSSFDHSGFGVPTIGTTQDPAGIQSELDSLYGGPVCIERVKYGAAALSAVKTRLMARVGNSMPLEPSIVPSSDIVLVALAGVSSSIYAQLQSMSDEIAVQIWLWPSDAPVSCGADGAACGWSPPS